MAVVFRILILPVFTVILLVSACNRIPDNPWTSAVPATTAILYTPAQQASLTEIQETAFAGFIKTTGSVQTGLITEIENVTGNRLLLRGAAIVPTSASGWSVVWITSKGRSDIDELSSYFRRAFTENRYIFNGVPVYRFFIRETDRIVFAAQVNDYIILSDNSLAVESALNSYLGIKPSMRVQGTLQPGNTYLNFPSFDEFVKTYTAVRFRPLISEAFRGFSASGINIEESAGYRDRKNYSISASVDLLDTGSAFIRAVSSEPAALSFDRNIPVDAAFFAMYLSPSTIDFDRLEISGSTDSSLVQLPGLLSALQGMMAPETAMAGFHTIGFTPLEETVYLRRIKSVSAVRDELNRLADRDLISKQGDTYYAHSRFIAAILGGSLCPYEHFYIGFHDDFLILSPRAGLIQRVRNDNIRRRVKFYDEEYTRLRNRQARLLSFFAYADSRRLSQFIQPYTDPVSDYSPFLSYFDVATMCIAADRQAQQASLQVHTYAMQRVVQPFADSWFLPLDGAELTGTPVIANLTAPGSRNVVFATTGNRVIALASDGTELFRVSTGEDRPIGSPIIYDWYANNQNAVLIAAGNKIYAWNNRGEPLPAFPFVLDERITSPIHVNDVTRSGLPEIITTTADRSIHILNSRGQNISGWPQRTNSVVRWTPEFKQINNRWQILAFAENGFFSFSTDGNLTPGFPVFVNASLIGKPIVVDNAVYAGGSDGNMYVFSNRPVIDDMHMRNRQRAGEPGNEIIVQIVSVSDSPLMIGGFKTVPLMNDFGSREMSSVLYMHSLNGSVFLYGQDGRLRFTQSMGQPTAERHFPLLEDINGNGQFELVTVAGFGRLYAWNTLTGERVLAFPATAVQYPVVALLAGQSQKTLIAGTEEGLRTWIFRN